MDKIRVAVVGVGYLGKQHVRIYRELENVELVGVVDKNPAVAGAVAAQFQTRTWLDLASLFGQVDAVSLAAPTTEHARLGCALLEKGIDVLVEKPIAASVDEANQLALAAGQNQRILQVGHLERFNPAVVAVQKMLTRPLFFEVHRLGIFTSRSLDVDVVLDLMIHDLDLVLAFANSPVKAVHAVGLPILTSKVDIANARIEFSSGAVANLTASRVSIEKVRKLRFFQPHEYISIDFTRQDVTVISVSAAAAGEKPMTVPRRLTPPQAEPLKEEIVSFLDKVHSRQTPLVTAESSTRALALAQQVLEKIREHAGSVNLASLR